MSCEPEMSDSDSSLSDIVIAIILLIFPPNTLFHRHRPIRPVRLTGFQQARQAFPLGLGLYRDRGSLVRSSVDEEERGQVVMVVLS